MLVCNQSIYMIKKDFSLHISLSLAFSSSPHSILMLCVDCWRFLVDVLERSLKILMLLTFYSLYSLIVIDLNHARKEIYIIKSLPQFEAIKCYYQLYLSLFHSFSLSVLLSLTPSCSIILCFLQHIEIEIDRASQFIHFSTSNNWSAAAFHLRFWLRPKIKRNEKKEEEKKRKFEKYLDKRK